MSTVVDGLAVALRALPRTDKMKIVSRLWEDVEFRQALVELLVGRPGRVAENGEGGDASSRSNPQGPTRPEIGIAIGRFARERYISDLKRRNIGIELVGNVWAKTSSGLWVAIPFATERQRNRWFLGLSGADEVRRRVNDGGVAMVLLCGEGLEPGGRVLDFVIPPERVREIEPKLGRSRGQLLFNLKRVGTRYYLVIPGAGSLDVSDYLGRVSTLQS